MNETGPDQERDIRRDNALTLSAEKPNQSKLPAGWRRGYAADCKSVKTGSIPVPASILHINALIFHKFLTFRLPDPPKNPPNALRLLATTCDTLQTQAVDTPAFLDLNVSSRSRWVMACQVSTIEQYCPRLGFEIAAPQKPRKQLGDSLWKLCSVL